MTAELTWELAQTIGGINIAYRIDVGRVLRVLILYLIAGFFAQQQNLPADAATPKHFVWVKYRQAPVDLADRRFEYLDTSRSSFITGAWYDSSNFLHGHWTERDVLPLLSDAKECVERVPGGRLIG